MRGRLAGAAALFVAVLGLGAGFFYLRGSDPVLVDWIAARKADHYCRSALGRIGIALAEWERSRPEDPYPATLEELARSGVVPGTLDLSCPLRDSSSPSYRLAPGVQLGMPPLAILAYEVEALHPERDEGGERTGRSYGYLLWASADTDRIGPERLAAVLRLQEGAVRGIEKGEVEPLAADLDPRRPAASRTFAAWALGRIRADGSAKARILDVLRGVLAREEYETVHLEAAYSLGRLGDPRGVGTVLGILSAQWVKLPYSERVRAVEFARKAWSDPAEPFDLDPLDSSPAQRERAARLRDAWKAHHAGDG